MSDKPEINEILFERLSGQEGMKVTEAVNNFTRQTMRNGSWFTKFCRPWMLKRMDFLAGNGPHPGPAPGMYPPPGWRDEKMNREEFFEALKQYYLSIDEEAQMAFIPISILKALFVRETGGLEHVRDVEVGDVVEAGGLKVAVVKDEHPMQLGSQMRHIDEVHIPKHGEKV